MVCTSHAKPRILSSRTPFSERAGGPRRARPYPLLSRNRGRKRAEKPYQKCKYTSFHAMLHSKSVEKRSECHPYFPAQRRLCACASRGRKLHPEKRPASGMFPDETGPTILTWSQARFPSPNFQPIDPDWPLPGKGFAWGWGWVHRKDPGRRDFQFSPASGRGKWGIGIPAIESASGRVPRRGRLPPPRRLGRLCRK